MLDLEQASSPVFIHQYFFYNYLVTEGNTNDEEEVVVGLVPDAPPIADWLNGEGLANPGPDPEGPLPDRNK